MLASELQVPSTRMPISLEENLSARLDGLSVEELEQLSLEQVSRLKMQRQQVMSKEERLNYLMSQFHRYDQKLDNLRRVRASQQSQENRLRELRAMKSQLDRQNAGKTQLGEELEKTKQLFSVREKELAEAVAKVDILSGQLERVRTSRSSSSSSQNSTNNLSSSSQDSIAAEIERLKQEKRFRTHLIQQQKRKIDDKEASLLQKTLQRNQLDQKISEIAERLQKRRSANDGPQQQQQMRPPLAAVGQHREGIKIATVEPFSQKLDGDVENIPETNGSYTKINRNPPPPPQPLQMPMYSIKPRLKHADIDRSSAESEASVNNCSSSGRQAKYQLQKKIEPPVTEEKPVVRENIAASFGSDLAGGEPAAAVNDRSTDTPDTSSSSESPPSCSSTVSVAISDPTPPKNFTHHRHGHISVVSQKDTVENVAKTKRRVQFDPQALLLDASLEGELDLVIQTCQQVMDPSACNDEGITALHNAICAGHFKIVKFLVEFGCDVNAQDSDGWSPLHCAASCNSLPMCKFLVEHGACIFAVTHSDQETAAQKCEEDEADYEGCSQYLLDSMKNLGKINDGIVYAVYDYTAQNADELTLKSGDKFKVLKSKDNVETEWFWAEKIEEGAPKSKPGYIPRNFFGLYPRVVRNPS